MKKQTNTGAPGTTGQTPSSDLENFNTQQYDAWLEALLEKVDIVAADFDHDTIEEVLTRSMESYVCSDDFGGMEEMEKRNVMYLLRIAKEVLQCANSKPRHQMSQAA